MMMHKWRSLFGTGCLAAVLVLFGAATAIAQPTNPPTELTLHAVDFKTLLLTWTNGAAGADADTTATMTEIAYVQRDSGDDFAEMTPMKMNVDIEHEQTTLEGLKAGKRYVVGIRAKNGEGTNPAADDDPPWVFGSMSTRAAPKPGNVDHRDVMIMPGDKMLMVEWEDPLPGHDDLMIKEYMVEFSKKEKSGYMMWPHKPTEPMVTITGLDNDTMYYVRIKAMNDAGGMSADWSKPVSGTPSADAMPTPALPVFGAFALGAGLLAAGRARLRRREQQRQLTRARLG